MKPDSFFGSLHRLQAMKKMGENWFNISPKIQRSKIRENIHV